ncbi:MAG: EAL domain-containing protein [Synergistaceae bacterium]|nr:EAL domain-containing protein [Synergistaceae bacterium]
MPDKMTEQELISSFDEAVKLNHIYAYYQPQINHSTGRMVGAEALMRWNDPVHGIQFPSDFVPVLEKNNLMHKADLHIFEQVCKFQRKCLDEKISLVPISVNMSRFDILNEKIKLIMLTP